MDTNCRIRTHSALRLAVGFSALIAGCATQPSSKSSASYQLSDVDGRWSWIQDPWHGEFVLTKDGDSYAGTLDDVYEGTYAGQLHLNWPTAILCSETQVDPSCGQPSFGSSTF